MPFGDRPGNVDSATRLSSGTGVENARGRAEAGSPAGLDFALDPPALRLAGDPETVLTTLTPTSVPVTTVGLRGLLA
ncbi:hypothetical protein SAMN04515665_1249 [Blastococcus sp. DSM 46786]|nr:hypothetical protein SAMN04515665_1249 [Blastococcus sp. DSM 46786]